jgi:hypothetical protein
MQSRKLFRHILGNLLPNAVKNTENGDTAMLTVTRRSIKYLIERLVENSAVRKAQDKF